MEGYDSAETSILTASRSVVPLHRGETFEHCGHHNPKSGMFFWFDSILFFFCFFFLSCFSFLSIFAECGTRPQLELAMTHRFEVKIGQPGGRWKAESQGFPTTTIRASEDLVMSVSKSCRLRWISLKFMKSCRLRRTRTHGRKDGHR